MYTVVGKAPQSQDLEERRELWDWGGEHLGRGTAGAKALRWKRAWCVR